jgi:FKBP-type peptidyl-prolyl cis-trans isomerase 2
MKVQQGDTVRVHYTGRLSDGNTFDSSENRGPLEFTVGKKSLIPGFEKAVEGMEPGEEKIEKIPCQHAYGERSEKLVFQVQRKQFPGDVTPETGQRLQMTQKDGQIVPVTVIEVDDQMVTLDANHPLAGEDLTFMIRVVEIVSSV